ncbi:hypothetical protein ACFLYE_02830 [Chloroflexota bacterium]
MAAKYETGQEVIISPVQGERFSPGDVAVEPYAGQIGKVADYYWISDGVGTKVFYVYTVRIEPEGKELVLHEDELEAYIA